MGKIDEYIKFKKTVSIPEIQKESGKGYRYARTFVLHLVDTGRLKKIDDLYFAYIKSKEDPLFIYALWLCIRENASSVNFLQKKLLIDEYDAQEISTWMLKNKYKKSGIFSEELISKEKFLSIYGPLDWDETDLSAFDIWSIDEPSNFKKMMHMRETKKTLFTFKEYFHVLENLVQNSNAETRKEFIRLIEDQYQIYKNDKKMMSILVSIMEEILLLDEDDFRFLIDYLSM